MSDTYFLAEELKHEILLKEEKLSGLLFPLLMTSSILLCAV